jgi:TolB-like protein
MRLLPRLALIAALLPGAAWAARPTVAVLPFSIDKHVIISDGRNFFAGTIEDETALLTNELVHQLVASRKFDVLERARLDDVLDEKDLQGSDYGSAGSLAKVAKLTGADYLVLGRIDRIGAESEWKSLPYSSRMQLQQKAFVDLYLRVVDAKSGRIVTAEKFVQETVLRDPKPTDSLGKKLVAETAQASVARLVESLFPLRIAKVDGKTVFLNRSGEGALAVGDRLAILSQGEAVRDSDTGEELGRPLTEVAQGRVVAVDAEIVKAELSGDALVKEGMRVKKLPPEKKTEASADLPPGPRW